MTVRTLTIAGVVIAASACARDPRTAAARDVASGDRYMANRQFKEAAIEFGRAVQARPEWAEAHVKRARAYLALGDGAKAYDAFARAADLDPAAVEAPLQAGTLALRGGDVETARTWAERAIASEQQNAAAHTLLGQALAGLRRPEDAVREIEEALWLDPSYVPGWTALGAARLRDGDRAHAGEAFERATVLAPSSVDARLALAEYRWAIGDQRGTEAALNAALRLDPHQRIAHHALALLYLSTKRAAAAEPHLKAVADRPDGAIALADYYLALDRQDAARDVLVAIRDSANKPESRAARLRIATIDYASGRTAVAYRAVDDLIRQLPDDEQPRLTRARWLIRDGDVALADRAAREIADAHPDSAPAQYTAGLAALATGNLQDAERAFRQVLTINPRAAAAEIQLARVHLAQGKASKAVDASQRAVKLQPEDPTAGVMMARSLRAAGDLSRAREELGSRLAREPRSAPLNVESGWLALERHDVASARSAFAAALQIDPHLYPAQAGLIAAEISGRALGRAHTLVEGWLRESPSNPSLRVLLAKVQLADRDAASAERTLRDVTTTTPSALEAYALLGQLYVSQGQLDRALGEYQALRTRGAADAGPLTMIGLIQEARGNAAAARTEYEQALAKNPSAGVAANNLAWLYAEDGRLDEALALATDAQSALRNRPEAIDTLGWVYLKRGEPRSAIAAFERAIAQAPKKSTYHYHLGLAHAQAGERGAAAAALHEALTLGLPDADRAAAQATLDGAAADGKHR
ncbi:MAG TPA: tetratricopeptide repeat protein [Vicinamibacterales bacterium]|nr:tetratricopeptide repeat protein [Vicinamibacterales bacterium]